MFLRQNLYFFDKSFFKKIIKFNIYQKNKILLLKKYQTANSFKKCSMFEMYIVVANLKIVIISVANML